MAIKLLKKLFKNKSHLRTGKLPNWSDILSDQSEEWLTARQNASTPKIIIPTCVGGQAAVTILESLLSVAMTLRGAKVEFLLCDHYLPACLHMHIKKIRNQNCDFKNKLNEDLCKGCFAKGNAVLSSTGLTVRYFSEYISPDERNEIKKLSQNIDIKEIPGFKKDGLNIGEHAKAGALRFFARGELDGEPFADEALRRYFEASMITYRVIENIFYNHNYEAAVFNHGIYVPHGIIGEVARKNNVRVVNWQVAYRKQCFIFSHHETYHHALISEDIKNWENIKWNKKIENETMAYLKSRWFGTNDWIWFHDQPKHNINDIKNELKINFDRPIVTALTNVFWDAQLHYKANAFTNMLEWLFATIDYFKKRSDLILVIRIHPAEVRGAIPSRQPVLEEINCKYNTLPENIVIVKPESQVSTYKLCECSDAVIIFGTKTGVETAAMGIPVIVAGEAWIRGKNLTHDAKSPEDYIEILNLLPFKKRLDKKQLERARKYAFHFFFRRFIPVRLLKPCDHGVPYEVDISTIKELGINCESGLSVLCDGIINGSEFIYEAEKRI